MEDIQQTPKHIGFQIEKEKLPEKWKGKNICYCVICNNLIELVPDEEVLTDELFCVLKR